LDGLDSIYADSITTNALDITTSFLGLPVEYYTGASANLQDQINNINTSLSENQGSWGSFVCLYTLNNPVANVIRNAYVSDADPSNNGVSMVDNNGSGLYANLQVDKAGVYNFQFSLQMSHTSSSSNDVFLWLRKNGTDVPASASKVTLAGNGDNQVPAWNFVVDLSGGDKLGLLWACGTTQMSMPYVGAQTTPFVAPAIPSVIITVTQVMNVSQGPKGEQGLTPSFSIGTVQGVPYGNSPQVSITGTSIEPILNFVLETGATGAQGPQGAQGPKGDKGEQGSQAQSTIEAIAAASAAAASAGVAAAAATAAATSATAAGTAATASATSATASAVSATASATSATEAAASAASIGADIAEIQAQIDVLDGQVTTLEEKTVNITAVAGVSTTITGTAGLYVDDITTLNITSPDILAIEATTSIDIGTTGQLSLGGGTSSSLVSDAETSVLAPVININSGVSSGVVNIGESLLDSIYIQGLPFVNINWNSTGFDQW
jgi:hypothetical protein